MMYTMRYFIMKNQVSPTRPCRSHCGVLLASATFATLIAGCTVGPDYQAPKPQPPEAWVSPTSSATTRPSNATTRPVQVIAWWTTFGDPKLVDLINRSIATNLDLKQAEARLRQARAVRGTISPDLWPSVLADGSYTRSRSSLSNQPSSLYKAGLDASWELDIFGGTRRNLEAADADILASEADRRGVVISLVSEVALNYLDLRGLQQEILIARSNLEAQQRSADLTRRRFNSGLNSLLDVANAEAQVATTQAQIPLLEQSAQQSIYNLSVLLGREPGALLQELSTAAPLPVAPPVVPIGLPSELLQRRPDVSKAEAQLHAATARIGVAKSDYFPKFSLTGSLGTSSSQPRSLVNWDNRYYSFGPSVSWTIFDAGRIRANVQVQNALQEQALLTYQSTVLTALKDVESALVAYVKEQQRHQALAEAVVQNQKAVDLSMKLYAMGQIDFLNVLSAQRSLLTSQDALVQSEHTVVTNLVALYKALGGGWEVAEPQPATRPAAKP